MCWNLYIPIIDAWSIKLSWPIKGYSLKSGIFLHFPWSAGQQSPGCPIGWQKSPWIYPLDDRIGTCCDKGGELLCQAHCLGDGLGFRSSRVGNLCWGTAEWIYHKCIVYLGRWVLKTINHDAIFKEKKVSKVQDSFGLPVLNHQK